MIEKSLDRLKRGETAIWSRLPSPFRVLEDGSDVSYMRGIGFFWIVMVFE